MTTNNIHGCYEERKACEPHTRGTPFKKKNQSTVTLIPVRKSLIHPRNKRITCEKDNDVGRTRMGGKYASVGQEGVGYR
jgi:hypothetical protein